MGWIRRITHISKPKKTTLLCLIGLMMVNDLGRLASMLTDLVLLGLFVIVLAKGLEDTSDPH